MPVVGFAGDGAFGISMNELTACGRGDWPPVTMVVFRNFQWGAEKRNTTLWYDDNFVGTELNKGGSKRGRGWGVKGHGADTHTYCYIFICACTCATKACEVKLEGVISCRMAFDTWD